MYDAVIAACAREAKADVFLTFDGRDFAGFVPGLQVREPAVR